MTSAPLRVPTLTVPLRRPEPAAPAVFVGEEIPAELDDEAWFKGMDRRDHASLKSYFMRLLPNRMGGQRTFFWVSRSQP